MGGGLASYSIEMLVSCAQPFKHRMRVWWTALEKFNFFDTPQINGGVDKLTVTNLICKPAMCDAYSVTWSLANIWCSSNFAQATTLVHHSREIRNGNVLPI